MSKENYQKKLDEIINKLSENKTVPKLLLHSCCAPCSTYVLEYLSQFFEITVFYYNPNIYPEDEYFHRADEQKKLIEKFSSKHKISFIEKGYNSEEFYEAVKGFEDIKEGGERCFRCYRLRLEETAKLAKELSFDFFATTLSISPHKNSDKLNEISEELSEIYEVSALPSDFKKRNGYKRSVELSNEYKIYRQNYCGCVFSLRERGQF